MSFEYFQKSVILKLLMYDYALFTIFSIFLQSVSMKKLSSWRIISFFDKVRHEIEPVIHKDDVYLVKKIIRTERLGPESWCLVKWQGYPSSMIS